MAPRMKFMSAIYMKEIDRDYVKAWKMHAYTESVANRPMAPPSKYMFWNQVLMETIWKKVKKARTEIILLTV